MKVSGLPVIQSYWLMLIATVITIAIVNASQLITQRISLLLDRQASELLAADLVVISNQPFVDAYARQARSLGLQVSTTTSLTTAIFIDDDAQLVELKAVDRSYPLRGQLEEPQAWSNPGTRWIRVRRLEKSGSIPSCCHCLAIR